MAQDFSKFIEQGMTLMYEVRPDGSKRPRWDTKPGSNILYDYGYTDEFTCGYVELIATQKAQGYLNTAAYVRLADDSLYAIAYPDHIYYDPKQWTLPGYFYPIGGWGHYLTKMKKVECTCGAAGWAKVTNQSCPGHGPLCEITRMGL